MAEWCPFDGAPESGGIPGGNPDAIVVDVEQRSSMWFAARVGVVTASGVSQLLTPTGQPRKGATPSGYIAEKVAERLTGTPEPHFTTEAMERGVKLEPEARNWYAFETGRDVRELGFVYGDATRAFGCSPDGLCGDRGLEIKCPMRKAMVGALISDEYQADYRMQVQFCMWVTGLPAWDVCYYHDAPEIPNRIWTVDRDERIHAAFAEFVPAFVREIDAAVWRLARGGEVAP